MPSFEHSDLEKSIALLDRLPIDSDEYAEWIEASAHLELLRRNGQSDEIIVYGSGEYSVIHAMVVANEKLDAVDANDLLRWNFRICSSIASYVFGGGSEDVRVEDGLSGTDTQMFQGGMPLIFSRQFEGMNGPSRSYFEVHQSYAHLANIHWRQERGSYCRFDGNGDIEHVVSITNRTGGPDEVSLVSFAWQPLEEYLVATNSSLVRMFDFTLLRRSGFSGWTSGPEEEIYESSDFFYNRKTIPRVAAYTRGVQIIRPRRNREDINRSIVDSWFGGTNEKYVEFSVYDLRHDTVIEVSTDPSATTNYFEAMGNDLPFELSPAFFRPEVLLKYKADRDKYTVGERDVSCRAAWHLEAIDVNEAGQVHAYICYLRQLPYSEQLHWASFNEKPKVGISKRAFINDFEGDFVDFSQPLRKVLNIVQSWRSKSIAYWNLRDVALVERVNTPVTDSRDEWAEAFMDLAKLVIEGFETKAIRAQLDEKAISYEKDDRTIALLEKLLCSNIEDGVPEKLLCLRSIQSIRSKAKGHVGGRDAERLATDALRDHGSFAGHFNSICDQLVDELRRVEECFPV